MWLSGAVSCVVFVPLVGYLARPHCDHSEEPAHHEKTEPRPPPEGVASRSDPAPEPARIDEGVFKVDDADGLIRAAFSSSEGAAFSADGQVPQHIGGPFLAVGPALSATKLGDPMAFARTRILGLRQFENGEVLTEETLMVRGLPAFRVTVSSKFDGTTLAGVVTLVPTGDSSYLIATGSVAEEKRAEYFPIFERITSTMRIE